jgi:hypothetical protein
MIALLTLVIVLLAFTESQADIHRYVSEDGTVYFTNVPLHGRGKVISKDKEFSNIQANIQGEKDRAYFKNNSFKYLAEKKARQHNMDPRLIKAVIKVESSWNPDAVSPKGAMGLMQLMPGTASDMGVANPFDPKQNIGGGVRYLRYLLDRFDGNLTLALAAYNAGPGVVERVGTIPSIPETITYVNRVMYYYGGTRNVAVEQPPLIKQRKDRIHRIVLNDGTMLFTNSVLPIGFYNE